MPAGSYWENGQSFDETDGKLWNTLVLNLGKAIREKESSGKFCKLLVILEREFEWYG